MVGGDDSKGESGAGTDAGRRVRGGQALWADGGRRSGQRRGAGCPARAEVAAAGGGAAAAQQERLETCDGGGGGKDGRLGGTLSEKAGGRPVPSRARSATTVPGRPIGLRACRRPAADDTGATQMCSIAPPIYTALMPAAVGIRSIPYMGARVRRHCARGAECKCPRGRDFKLAPPHHHLAAPPPPMPQAPPARHDSSPRMLSTAEPPCRTDSAPHSECNATSHSRPIVHVTLRGEMCGVPARRALLGAPPCPLCFARGPIRPSWPS